MASSMPQHEVVVGGVAAASNTECSDDNASTMRSPETKKHRTETTSKSDDDDDVSSSSSSSDDSKDDQFRSWLNAKRQMGIPVSQVLSHLGLRTASDQVIDDESFIWDTLFRLGLRVLQKPPRKKLSHVNTFEDVTNLLKSSSKIVILTGAGISVSCGIPDFRSENGIYSRLGQYNLPTPESMFDISFFKTNPHPFFAFANELFPKEEGYSFVPSSSHCFFKLLEEKNKLLRIYSQNIDMLEYAAGVSEDKCVLCHGSFATATCLECRESVPGSTIRGAIASKTVPTCTKCNSETSVVKPDIVFFGEQLPRRFHDCMAVDMKEADLVLVMGTSLNVSPVRDIVADVPEDVPIVLINREIAGRPHEFDVNLLGYCDNIVSAICSKLQWAIPSPPVEMLASSLRENDESTLDSLCHTFEAVLPGHYLFEGAVDPTKEESSEDGASSSDGESLPPDTKTGDGETGAAASEEKTSPSGGDVPPEIVLPPPSDDTAVASTPPPAAPVSETLKEAIANT